MTLLLTDHYSYNPMKVHGIKQLIKKDIPLYYRNEYGGQAELEILGDQLNMLIEFTVEMRPTGEKMVEVKLLDRIDYPLVPVIKALKKEILLMEEDGRLR